MKPVIVLLAIAGAVLCQREIWNDFGGHGGRFAPDHRGPAPPAYLQSLSQEAQQEFFAIAFNKSVPTSQQNQQLLEWAKRHKVLDKMKELHSKIGKGRDEMNVNVTKLIADMPSPLQKHSAVMENGIQDPMELFAALQKLNAENPQLYRVVEAVIKQFVPWHGPYGPRPGGYPGVPGLPYGPGFQAGPGGYQIGQGGYSGGRGGYNGGHGFPYGRGGYQGGPEFPRPGGFGGYGNGRKGFMRGPGYMNAMQGNRVLNDRGSPNFRRFRK